MKKSFEINFDWKKYFIVSENFIRQKENSEIEFKESFHSPKGRDKKLHKWIASFANANGGLIIYGIKNNGELIGLKDNKLKDFDNKDLSQELLNFFSPEIKFELFIKNVENYELGFLYIYKAEDKPIITIKSAGNSIQESDIYYRYPGQSRKISYGDLRTIIEDKSNKLNEKWLSIINNIASIGVENVGLLNIEKGELLGTKNKLLIPEELLDKVKFINEGRFDEKEGAPALKLIGEVLPINSSKIIQLVEKKYQIITHFELYKSFLEQSLDVDTAKEFFRKVLYENTVYYPIYYYLYKANLDFEKVENLLKKEKGSKIKDVEKRLKNEKVNYKRFENGNLNTKTDAAKKILKSYNALKNKEDIQIKGIPYQELRYIIQGITHLKENEIDVDYILSVVKNIYDNHFNQSSTTKSFIRKAICHIDLTVFGKYFFDTQ